MPLTNTETRNFQGLFLQQNSFDVPDGAFEEAMNVQIQSDGIISKTRGFYTYYTPPTFPPEELRGIYEYQNVLLAATQNRMTWFQDDFSDDPNSPVGIRTVLTGDPFSIQLDISRSAKQNQNLYWNTYLSIMKLESYSGKVRRTGVPPALDLTVEVGTSATG